MLCKKCGANIADTSKFCGYCGNPLEILNEPVNNPQPTEIEVNKSTEIVETTNSVDLGNTIKVEPIQPEVQNVVEPVVSETIQNEQSGNSDMSTVTVQPAVDSQLNHDVNVQMNQQIGNDTVQNAQVPVNGPVMPETNNPKNKKSNKLIFIVGGIILAVIAIVVVLFAFMKSSESSISVLKKALANIEEKGENSATAEAKLSFATSTGESFSFSATVKAEKKNEDEMDMSITLNKSLFFDEMNVYASMTKEEITMYMQSSLIDMMGTTSSLNPSWIYYTIALDEVLEEENLDETVEEINIEDIIDEKHFVYVDESNDVRHYELIIDQELIDTMKTKLATLDDKDMQETLNSLEPLEKSIRVGFYINKSNELVKIELDMTEYLEDAENLSSFIMSVEFKDLNNTKVEIPSEAKNSVTDLNTYMITNSTNNYDSDYDYDLDSGFDSNYDYDFDSSFDSSYDNIIDTDLNSTVY